MTTQLLIYERATPITRDRHGGWSVKTGKDYSFAKHVNAVPLTAVEFASAGGEYAIVFAGQGDTVMPSVVLGVRNGENRYVADDGTWTARYVPAFLRRYPFVFSSTDQGKTFTLCIDEEYAGFNQEGRGERLFDADGERTRYLEGVLQFLQQYQAEYQRTQAFCRKLQELDLLTPRQLQITDKRTGAKASLGGFLAVDRDRLKALSGDQLADLARTDELELLYIHLQSMRHLVGLAERGAGEEAAESTDPSGASPVDAEVDVS